MMTQTILVSEQDFEAARLAFVRAWHDQDELLEQLAVRGVPGTRTRAGLVAALSALGIGVEQ